MTHTLIVTPSAARPDDEDGYSYEVDCPGVTDSCRLWEDCGAGFDEQQVLENRNERHPVAHGKRHSFIDSLWMAETTACYVATHDGLPDAVSGSFAPGRHAIDFDCGGGTELVVLAVAVSDDAR